MTVAWNWFWLATAFLSELAALAALGFWGWSVAAPGAVRAVLAGLSTLLSTAPPAHSSVTGPAAG